MLGGSVNRFGRFDARPRTGQVQGCVKRCVAEAAVRIDVDAAHHKQLGHEHRVARRRRAPQRRTHHLAWELRVIGPSVLRLARHARHDARHDAATASTRR